MYESFYVFTSVEKTTKKPTTTTTRVMMMMPPPAVILSTVNSCVFQDLDFASHPREPCIF